MSLERSFLLATDRVLGIKGEKTSFKTYSAKDEAISIATGQRITTLDVRVSSYFRLADIKTRLNEVNAMTSKIRYAKTEDDMIDLQKRQAEAYKEIAEDYSKIRKAAITLGMTMGEFESVKKKQRIKFPWE